jgi:hypothetical protein
LMVLISASEPVWVAFWLPRKIWAGSWDSDIPSWPEGMKAYVLWPEGGEGMVLVLMFLGRARRAWRIMYWCGGHAFGASLLIDLSQENSYEKHVGWKLPLQPGIHKGSRIRPVIPMHNHI